MSQFISLQEAIDMTTAYRENRNTVLKTEYAGATILPNSETFDRLLFDQVLTQQGCEALRIYYGMDESMKVHSIIVGVNGKNEDMLPATISITASEEFSIINHGDRCPNECPPESPLNS